MDLFRSMPCDGSGVERPRLGSRSTGAAATPVARYDPRPFAASPADRGGIGMNNVRVARCPHCGSGELYVRRVSTNGYMPILKGLGEFLRFAKLDVVLCADCGHCSFFAAPAARAKVRDANGWR